MCPTAISMNAYVLRIHILPYVVELCSESVLTRHPDTGFGTYVLTGIEGIRVFRYGGEKPQFFSQRYLQCLAHNA